MNLSPIPLRFVFSFAMNHTTKLPPPCCAPQLIRLALWQYVVVGVIVGIHWVARWSSGNNGVFLTFSHLVLYLLGYYQFGLNYQIFRYIPFNCPKKLNCSIQSIQYVDMNLKCNITYFYNIYVHKIIKYHNLRNVQMNRCTCIIAYNIVHMDNRIYVYTLGYLTHWVAFKYHSKMWFWVLSL